MLLVIRCCWLFLSSVFEVDPFFGTEKQKKQKKTKKTNIIPKKNPKNVFQNQNNSPTLMF